MPNAVQKFARLIVKRIRRVASSTSSPPIGTPGDVGGETAEVNDANLPDVTEQAEVYIPEHGNLNPIIRRSDLSDIFEVSVDVQREPEVEDDFTMELETLKSLRIEDALNQSRKMQASEKRPQVTNVRRLMKELRLMRKASEESDGAFEVEPCSTGEDGDNCDLSVWEVRFYKFDETSDLWRSMQLHGIDCVKLHVTFPTDFPLSPPFVRLISPYIENGFVMNGGAICLEVLTSQGWSSAYTVEALLVQVTTSLAHGGAVVSKHQKRKQRNLTKKRAEVEFQRIIKIHDKYGWVNLDKEEG